MTNIADQTLILIDKQQQAIGELTDIAKAQSALIDEMVMTIRSQAVVIKDKKRGTPKDSSQVV